MNDPLPYILDDSKALPVKGELLSALIDLVRQNQLSAGPGLVMEKNATGTLLWVDQSTTLTPPIFAAVGGRGSEAGRFTGEQVPALDGGAGIVPDWATYGVFYDGDQNPELVSVNGMPYMPNAPFHVRLFDATLAANNGEITPVKAFIHPISPFSPFPVTMEQTGGTTAGDETTQCDWTYTVTDPSGNELATGVNPTVDGYHTRPTVGTMTAATHGLAYYSAEPLGPETVLYIAQCNEYLDFEACS